MRERARDVARRVETTIVAHLAPIILLRGIKSEGGRGSGGGQEQEFAGKFSACN